MIETQTSALLSGVLGLSGLLGVLVGALVQYYFGQKSVKAQIELSTRSELYQNLFSQLRDTTNDTITIQNLICDAQIYASDDVVDILAKIGTDKVEPKLLWDLLCVIRKELRVGNSKRNLSILMYERVSPPIR